MPSIPCPECGRLLKFGEDLFGALVECPMCGTSFEAPHEEPPPPRPAPPPYRPVPAPAHARPRTGPTPLEFNDPDGAGGLSARQRARLTSASFWLQAAVALQGISGFCCCMLPGRFANDFRANLVVWAVVCKYVPLLFGAVAANRLSARRGYRLAYAGALLILLGTVWTLLETFGLFIMVMTGPGSRMGADETVGAGVLGILLGAAGVLAGFVGSIKTLIVLGDASVRSAFR